MELICEFCENPAVYRAKACMGAPMLVCKSCSELGPAYQLIALEETE